MNATTTRPCCALCAEFNVVCPGDSPYCIRPEEHRLARAQVAVHETALRYAMRPDQASWGEFISATTEYRNAAIALAS